MIATAFSWVIAVLVDAAADQRVVDVGHRHQARRNRDVVAAEAFADSREPSHFSWWP